MIDLSGVDSEKKIRAEALQSAIFRHPHCAETTVADILYDAAAYEHFINHGSPEGALAHVAELDLKNAVRLGLDQQKSATVSHLKPVA